MSRFNWAPTAYKLLNGVLCIYKPDQTPVHMVVESLKSRLCKDLNALPCYQHEILMRSKVKENLQEKSLSLKVDPSGIEDWSEHRLVLGDRYEESDIKIHFVDGISKHSSGVLVLGLGTFGRESVEMIAMSKYLRVYHVKGRFGWATHNFSPKGRILQRTSFKHVTIAKLEKVCAAAQAAHTREMYRLSGVNPDSQEAYEMASSGIIKPAERKTSPVLYSIKCTDFQPPDFTLEIHSINESCLFLRQFIHQLAIKLKTTAVCTAIRRIRYGTFDLQRALVRQQWHLDNIIDNIESNNELLTPERLMIGHLAERVQLPPPSHQYIGYSKGDQHLIGEEVTDEFSDLAKSNEKELIVDSKTCLSKRMPSQNKDPSDTTSSKPP